MPLSGREVSALEDAVKALKADPAALHATELAFFRQYLTSLGASLPPAPEKKPAPQQAPPPPMDDDEEEEEPISDDEPLPEEVDEAVQDDAEAWAPDSLDDYFAPTGADDETDEGQDRAMELKAAGQDLFNDGAHLEAIAKLTEAMKLKPSSAMWWALRANIYLKMKKANAAIADATQALERNPDSAKALRVRGIANRHLGHWEKAADDLNAAQKIDYDENAAELLKEINPRVAKRREVRHLREQRQFEHRQKQLRKQRERERRADAKEQAKAHAGAQGGFPGGMPGGMPGMGGMGGMPGMGGGMPGGMPAGMEEIFGDPEIAEALKDPEVAQKMSLLMSNPAAAMQLMGDPKVGPIMQKIMAKMGGGMGMPGMGGMGGRGGMPPGGARRAPPSGGMPKSSAAPPQPKAAPSSRANDDLD